MAYPAHLSSPSREAKGYPRAMLEPSWERGQKPKRCYSGLPGPSSSSFHPFIWTPANPEATLKIPQSLGRRQRHSLMSFVEQEEKGEVG
jgi:hypothetical protein